LVPISDCNTKYFNSNPKQEMSFNEFIDYLKKVQKIGYNYEENGLKILYLKDWHFVHQFPDYKAYETPVYFESDWINEYFIKNIHLNDDYRFVYFGPKQSSYSMIHSFSYLYINQFIVTINLIKINQFLRQSNHLFK